MKQLLIAIALVIGFSGVAQSKEINLRCDDTGSGLAFGNYWDIFVDTDKMKISKYEHHIIDLGSLTRGSSTDGVLFDLDATPTHYMWTEVSYYGDGLVQKYRWKLDRNSLIIETEKYSWWELDGELFVSKLDNDQNSINVKKAMLKYKPKCKIVEVENKI